jgi:hypothetical protein
MSRYLTSLLSAVVALWIHTSFAWAQCDRVLIEEALMKSSSDVQAAAVQLVLTREDFEQLKAALPDGVVGTVELRNLATFEQFSDVRTQLARRYNFAYGLYSARASLVASVSPDILAGWNGCMRRMAETTPGLYSWVAKLMPDKAEVSVS